MRIKNVTLVQLRTFLSLVRNESFTKAGQDLAVSPATVTAQIKQLEDALDATLVFRTTRSVRLTDAGAVLARQATKILHLIEAIPERLGAVENLERGEVSVGIIGTAGYVMPKVLATYQEEHPGIHLDLMMGNRNTIWDAILEGKIDIGIMGTPPEDTNIESAVIGEHQLIFVAHPKHPLSKLEREITARELIRYQLIAREVGSGTRLAMAAYFGALFHQTARTPVVLDTNEGIKQAVLAGMGISMLSEATCEIELHHGLLKRLTVEGTPIPRQWYAIRVANMERNPAEISLLDFLAKQTKQA